MTWGWVKVTACAILVSCAACEDDVAHRERHASGLEGAMAHVFPATPVGDAAGALEHVFTLEHTGSEVLHIGAIKSTCGCVGAKPSSMSVAPGETVSLAASMKLGGIGTKTAAVSIQFTDSALPPLVLSLTGRGTPRRALMVNPAMARASADNVAHVALSMVIPDGGVPPEVQIACPDGVTHHESPWRSLPKSQHGPHRFERRVEFQLPPLFRRGAVTIGMDGHPDRIVQLVAGD